MKLWTITACLALAIVAILGFLLRDTFVELKYYWFDGFNWLFFVPILFAYMLWQNRKQYFTEVPHPSYAAGLPLLLISGGLLFGGSVASIQAVRELALMGFVFGLVLTIFGWKQCLKLAIPLLYLGLMTSAASMVFDSLKWPLKYLSAVMSAATLNAIGYHVLRDGAFIRLTQSSLQVADSCSGLNQLISMIALSIPLAVIHHRQWWKRMILVGFGFFMALSMNWVRIILIALWHYDSPKVSIHGPGEIYSLPFIFLAGFILLLILSRFLSRNEPASVSTNATGTPALSALVLPGLNRSLLVTFLTVFAVTAVVEFRLPQPKPVSDGLTLVPPTLNGTFTPDGEWIGPFPTNLAQINVTGRVTLPTGQVMHLYRGYFEEQTQTHEIDDYRYKEVEAAATAITIPSSGEKISVASYGGRFTYFWYTVKGSSFAGSEQAKWAALKHGLKNRHTNALVTAVVSDTRLEEFPLGVQMLRILAESQRSLTQ